MFCSDFKIVGYCVHRVLEVDTLDKVSREGIFALRKLTSLREFLYHPGYSQSPVVRLCLELLPHLHHLQDVDGSISLFDITKPCTVQLRNLSTHDLYDVSDFVSFPELRSLTLWDRLEMHPLFAGGLPKLSELYLKDTDQDNLLVVLGHVGRQLKKLHVSIMCVGVHLKLDRVMGACPNLSELKVSTDSNQLDGSQLQLDTLKHLESVTFELSEREDFLQPGLLLQFLRKAPQLRSVNVTNFNIHHQDLKEWAELAEHSTCMQNLQQIQLQFYATRRSEEAKPLWQKVLSSCSINCPQLQIASVKYMCAVLR